ncbi:MAG: hypothetical protein QOK28_3361 [Actinomycetota bacterium]|jgi:chorismate-pyruvate lyase
MSIITIEPPRPTNQFSGWTIAYEVCSDSVQTAGLVRQVVVHSTQTIIVDAHTTAPARIAAGTLIDVKVTSGRPCGLG